MGNTCPPPSTAGDSYMLWGENLAKKQPKLLPGIMPLLEVGTFMVLRASWTSANLLHPRLPLPP